MEREVLKNQALDLLKECRKIPGYTIKSDYVKYRLQKYINEYESIKNKSAEEEKILHNLKIQAHRTETHGITKNTNSKSSRYDDDER